MTRSPMIYGVYEDDEFETCVYVGTAVEISLEFGIKVSTVYDVAAMPDRLLNCRYKVVKIGYENDLERIE